MSGLHRHTLSFPGRLSGVTSTVRAAQTVEVERPKEQPVQPANDQAIAQLQASLSAAVAEAAAFRAKVRDEIAGAAVSLAVEIAQRLLQNEIANDRQRLDRIVNKFLAQMPASRGVTVRGHADDLALLQKQLDEYTLIGGAGDEMTLRADPAAARGTLKLESDDCFFEWNTPHSLGELSSLLLEDTHEAD